MSVAERNERIARRCASTFATKACTLTVPAGIVITPSLIAALPPPTGTWHLTWHPAQRPIVWRGDGTPSSSTPSSMPLPDGAVLDASTSAAQRASAWRLLRASGKQTDGWLARHVHRKISRIGSYALLGLGLSANHATLLTFLIGVVAASLVAQTTHATMIAGALLFWFASIADGIDGEMARLTLTESARGEQLDTAVDLATYVFAYTGVVIGWWRQGIGPAGWTLAIGVAIGLPVVLLRAMQLLRKSRRVSDPVLVQGDVAAPFFVDIKPIELAVADAARATGAPMLRLASALFVLFRREAFSLAFVLVSLVTPRRAVYPALLAAGLAVVVATLLSYGSEIEAAITTRARQSDQTPS